ncbi:MAG: cytochrome c oxidase assembly factor Coa1 family protein [Ferruginibacter sp.]
MEQLNALSSSTKKVIIIALAFLLYGYVCRLAGIYFFWESKTIGWTSFWIAVIFILRDRIKIKRVQNKKTLLEKIGIGFSIFVIIMKGILFFATQQTSAYDIALTFIKTNPEIQNRVGKVNSVSLIPLGGMAMTTNAQGSAGQADLHFIVKGSKKYIDLNLLMNKEFDTDWQMEIIR